MNKVCYTCVHDVRYDNCCGVCKDFNMYDQQVCCNCKHYDYDSSLCNYLNLKTKVKDYCTFGYEVKECED